MNMINMNNQMGMNMNNQMNMMDMNNQMGMNINNPMWMNNQMNSDFATRIKNILEPYEKKIKDLEEQLRQKNFEIVVLKEKLLQAEKKVNTINMPIGMGNPMGMQMGMGMGGPMGMQMGMGNPMEMQIGMGMAPPLMNMNNIDPDVITIIFRIANGENHKNQPLTQKCFIDDEFGFVQKKVLKKLNVTGEIRFIFNVKKINPTLAVSELGITNNSNVFIVSCVGIGSSNHNHNRFKISLKEKEDMFSPKKNVMFICTKGLKTLMILEENISIGLAIKKYLMRVGIEELINDSDNKIAFIYSGKRYKINDNIKLKDLFENNNNPSIIVNDVNRLIGA